MLSTLSIALGALLITASVVDVYLTTIAATGAGGPITRGISTASWRVAWVLPIGQRHRRLTAAGHLILVAVVLGWFFLIWAGSVLLFLSDPASIIDSTTKQPAGIFAKMAFTVGGFAGAGAGFVATSGGWEALNNITAVLGLSWAALTLTYLFRVVTAAAHKRAIALRILGIADDPATMAATAGEDGDLGLLGQHLTNITQDVALVARHHDALPTLTYFHIGERTAAIEVAVAVLDEALTVLEARDRGTHAAARPMRVAIAAFLDTAGESEADRAPALPSSERLHTAGVDVTDEALLQRAEEVNGRRRRLFALVEGRGWSWDDDVLGVAP